MGNRIVYLDSAKFICIFLMVVGHWTSNETILSYIYSFHMPALFVISGYLYKPRKWYKTVLSFGIPVVFYSIINLFVLIVLQEISIEQLYTKETVGRFLHYRYGLGDGFYVGDWFLWALLGLRFFYGDIKFMGFLRSYYIPIAIITITYMSFESSLVSIDSLFRGWYIGRMIPSMPFFCLGFLLKDHKIQIQNHNYPVMLILGCLFILLPLFNGSTSINSNQFGLSYIIFFINASISTLFVFRIANNIPQNKFITTISKGTLLVLGLHIPIMKTLDFIFPTFLHDLLPLFVLPICYYPILWLEKWCPPLIGRIKL